MKIIRELKGAERDDVMAQFERIMQGERCYHCNDELDAPGDLQEIDGHWFCSYCRNDVESRS